MLEYRLRNLVISGFGTRLEKEGDLIRISYKEGDEVKSTLVSPHVLEQVIITGECSLSSGFVRLLIENGVDLVFIEHKPAKFFARVVRGDSNFITEIWRKQMSLPVERKIEIAKEIVDASVYNKIRVLQRISNDMEIDAEECIDRLVKCKREITSVSKVEDLMGFEGIATRTYFEIVRRLIPEEFGFDGREKHPPKDPVNSLLSYGYTVLLSRVEYSLMLAGLNPFEGLLHSTYRERPALGFDLIEEFRQPIVDRVVISMILKNQIGLQDFEQSKDFCTIKEDAKRRFLNALYSRLEDRKTHEGQDMAYLDIIMWQAKKLADAISKNVVYKAFRWW